MQSLDQEIGCRTGTFCPSANLVPDPSSAGAMLRVRWPHGNKCKPDTAALESALATRIKKGWPQPAHGATMAIPKCDKKIP